MKNILKNAIEKNGLFDRELLWKTPEKNKKKAMTSPSGRPLELKNNIKLRNLHGDRRHLFTFFIFSFFFLNSYTPIIARRVTGYVKTLNDI